MKIQFCYNYKPKIIYNPVNNSSEQMKKEIENSVVLLEYVLEGITAPDLNERSLDDLKTRLSQLVQTSVIDEARRNQLSVSLSIWRLLKAIFEQTIYVNDVTAQNKVRLQRGAVLLGRNLLSMSRDHAEELDIRSSVFKLLESTHNLKINKSLKDDVAVSCFQLLSNLTTAQDDQDPNVLLEMVSVFEFDDFIDDTIALPVLTYLSNIFRSSRVLTLALSKGEGKPILQYLLEEFEKLEIANELSTYELIIVKIFCTLVVHESFLKFITLYNQPCDTIRYLRAAEVIITSRESWDVLQLTVILSWVNELFIRTIPDVELFFENGTGNLSIMYQTTFICLDIFSSLVKFEHAAKFLLFYKSLENLIKLLGIIHHNVKPKRLKDTHSHLNFQTEQKDFPNIKSMITEILASLVYNNFEAQERVRELHGLELVLSNCVLDANEPFIKERSIICLRFLLLNNEKNQEFVSKLEARQAVPDQTLDEAGFDVEIVDGKVKLRQKDSNRSAQI